jgi:hypothetical protein
MSGKRSMRRKRPGEGYLCNCGLGKKYSLEWLERARNSIIEIASRFKSQLKISSRIN